jgi:hypothetical protein
MAPQPASGSSDIMGGNAALPPGAVFLPKPYKLAELLGTVRRRLEGAPS